MVNIDRFEQRANYPTCDPLHCALCVFPCFRRSCDGDWFTSGNSQSAQSGTGLALVNEPLDAFALNSGQPVDTPDADLPALNFAQLYMGGGLPTIEDNPLEFYG